MGSVGTLIKRVVIGGVVLAALGFGLIFATVSYFENNEAARDRLEVSAQIAERRVDPDASVFTKFAALVDAWWDSDEVVADIQTDKELQKKNEAAREKEAEAERFNSSPHEQDNDYYGAGE